MKILVACEESQAVCIEFRKKGHDAFSCDILPCSGGHPEWHIQGDVSEQRKDPIWHVETMKLPKTERAKIRSKTFPGIAKAMADQWG